MDTLIGLLIIGGIMFIIIGLLVKRNDFIPMLLAGILIAGVALGLYIYMIFSWGYVMSQFYDWFVLRYYPKLPHFTIVQFIGFSFLISTFFRHSGDDIKDEFKKSSQLTRSIISLLNPWLTLLLGYMFYSWFVV